MACWYGLEMWMVSVFFQTYNTFQGLLFNSSLCGLHILPREKVLVTPITSTAPFTSHSTSSRPQTWNFHTTFAAIDASYKPAEEKKQQRQQQTNKKSCCMIFTEGKGLTYLRISLFIYYFPGWYGKNKKQKKLWLRERFFLFLRKYVCQKVLGDFIRKL